MPEKPAAAKPTTRFKPGLVNKHIHIYDAAWAKIIKHVDANCLDLDKWLTKQFSEVADKLE